MAGLTLTGFVPKTLSDVKTELEAAFQAAFGASIDLSATSNFSQLIGIMAERFADLWDVAQAVYSASDPDKATGQALVAICALTGTVPKSATASTATVVASGTAGTVLLAGRVISVEVIGTKFDTNSTATLAAATAWTATTAYGVGAVVKNAGNIYYCVVGGSSAGAGGPSTTLSSITDGSVTWTYIGLGAAYALIQVTAEETGPRIAAAGSLNVIETGVAGWNAVRNPAVADLGADAELDPELRIRREDELLGNAKSTIDAIRVRIVEDVPDVFGVIVFQNDTDFTNADGMPPHSVEVLARGGVDQDIIDAVFANVAAGITSFGNTPGTFVDVDNGEQTYTVKFSRPTPRNTWVTANIIKDPNTFPADGASQIATALLNYGASLPTGKDVVSSRLKAVCFGVDGVLDVTTCFVGLAVTPVSEATITIALRDLAVFDATRIIVNVSDGTP
jgi:uncharacterized phage protein gp47/JayE